MSCSVLHPDDCIKAGISSGVDQLAQTFQDGAEWAMKNLTTAWLHAPAPDVTSSTSVTGWIQEHLSYFVAATMLLSVLVAAYRLATTGKFEHGRDLAESLTRVIVVTAVAGTITMLGVQIGEAFSTWILDQANVEFDFTQIVVFSAVGNSGIVLLLAIVVIFAQLIQLLLMIARNGMIIILAGVLPLAAAAGNTQMGRQWWQKSFAWLLAFVLYKPVAALLYAASFKMISKEQDIATQLSGICMMLLALFALPALMRFMVPATAAMSGGNAGAMAGAVVGAALATGAVLATGGAAAGGFAGASASGAATSGAATASPAATGATGGAVTSGPSGGGGVTGTPGTSGGGNDGTPGLSSSTASGASDEGSSPQSAGPGTSGPSGSGGGGSRASTALDAASAGRDAARIANNTASGATGEESS